jgi:hypothetical protein
MSESKNIAGENTAPEPRRARGTLQGRCTAWVQLSRVRKFGMLIESGRAVRCHFHSMTNRSPKFATRQYEGKRSTPVRELKPKASGRYWLPSRWGAEYGEEHDVARFEC